MTRVTAERCTFMFNSWKRCEQLAGPDGRCGAHGKKSDNRGWGFRRTSSMFHRPRRPI